MAEQSPVRSNDSVGLILGEWLLYMIFIFGGKISWWPCSRATEELSAVSFLRSNSRLDNNDNNKMEEKGANARMMKTSTQLFDVKGFLLPPFLFHPKKRKTFQLFTPVCGSHESLIVARSIGFWLASADSSSSSIECNFLFINRKKRSASATDRQLL